MSKQQEALFLPTTQAADGQRFCLYYPAGYGEAISFIRGVVLYIHPFAEEMNKARRMAALQSRALARAGFAVLQMDLRGCGDSAGDFQDASWSCWVNDIVRGCQHLRSLSETSCAVPLWLWGLRAGCLLAADAARQLDEDCNFLFWQPPTSGRQLLQQFLRLNMVAGKPDDASKGAMERMRQALASGQTLDVAGYRLSPWLASGLEQSSVAPPGNGRLSKNLVCLELSRRTDACLSAGTTGLIAQWQQAGFQSAGYVTRGPAFWSTNEIEEVPALISTTTTALLQYSI